MANRIGLSNIFCFVCPINSKITRYRICSVTFREISDGVDIVPIIRGSGLALACCDYC